MWAWSNLWDDGNDDDDDDDDDADGKNPSKKL